MHKHVKWQAKQPPHVEHSTQPRSAWQSAQQVLIETLSRSTTRLAGSRAHRKASNALYTSNISGCAPTPTPPFVNKLFSTAPFSSAIC
jgi:hypothetical protein